MCVGPARALMGGGEGSLSVGSELAVRARGSYLGVSRSGPSASGKAAGSLGRASSVGLHELEAEAKPLGPMKSESRNFPARLVPATPQPKEGAEAEASPSGARTLLPG